MGARVGTEGRPLRVAVIGTGPGGFYAAVALLNQKDVVTQVDLFDRLPTPYGLVRGGVAPDHQKIKSVIRVYAKAAARPNCRFFGNVELGRDVSVEDLSRVYDQLVFAVGNESERRMGIPGEELDGCCSAGKFVGWYNAHPDFRQERFRLDCERVAIVGNGNVAIDVARILAKQPDDLLTSDAPDYALDALRESKVREIVMLGRRGPVQAAFSPLELKELSEISQAGIVIDPAELDLDALSQVALDEAKQTAPSRRNVEILRAAPAQPEPSWQRHIRFRFLVSPVELLADNQGRLRSVRLEQNRLEQEDGWLRASGTGVFEELTIGALFSSIGYRGKPTPGVPFDDRRGLIPSSDGRVLDAPGGTVIPNQYVVGWARSGPKGLIGMHKSASGEVVGAMLEDLQAGSVPPSADVGANAIVELLEHRGITYVSFEDWERIDLQEVERGNPRGAPRRKFCTIDQLVAAAKQQ